jgi:glutamate formiminotransferase/glutamate formiminotransferase/formiminotetrahydrofolate cyclodeaminase
LYGSAALLPERRNLANLRKPGAGPPDVGGPDRHPSAGIIACGARKFLIAFNVNLKSKDTAAARRIASAVRESSGGLPCVQALGLELASRGLTQVSMNLTDFETTPLHVAFLAVESEAARTGIEIEESELIGLIPRKAWELSSHVNMRLLGWNEGLILENRLPG